MAQNLVHDSSFENAEFSLDRGSWINLSVLINGTKLGTADLISRKPDFKPIIG